MHIPRSVHAASIRKPMISPPRGNRASGHCRPACEARPLQLLVWICHLMDFIFYRDVFGGWRWELRAADGHMQDSEHGYDTREECVQAAEEAAAAEFSHAARAPHPT